MKKRVVRRRRRPVRRIRKSAPVKGLVSYVHKKQDICFRGTVEGTCTLAMSQGNANDLIAGVMFNYPGWVALCYSGGQSNPALISGLSGGQINLNYPYLFGSSTCLYDEYRVKKLEVSVMPVQNFSGNTGPVLANAAGLGSNPWIYLLHDIDTCNGNPTMLPLAMNDPTVKTHPIVQSDPKWSRPYVTTPACQAAPRDAWYDCTFTQAPYPSQALGQYSSISALESLGSTFVVVPRLSYVFGTGLGAGSYNVVTIKCRWFVEFRGMNVRG